MVPDPFDPSYGNLNQIKRPIIRRRFGENSTIAAIRQAALGSYNTDSLAGIGCFRGIVLRIERTDIHYATDWLNRLSPLRLPQLVKIKVRIPEIHVALPIPSSFDDNLIIDMYPTFIAENENLPFPEVGSMVYVDYNDRANLEDPIYISPISCESSTGGYLNSPVSGRASFGSAGGGSNTSFNNGEPHGGQDDLGSEIDGPRPPNGDFVALTRRRRSPSYIVLHSTEYYEDSVQGMVERWQRAGSRNSNRQVSTHFVIMKTGEILSLVSIEYSAWHALGFNNSIGIDLEARVGGNGDTNRGANLPRAQIESLRALLNSSELGALPVVGHGQTSPSRRSDPGSNFDWANIVGPGRSVSTNGNLSSRQAITTRTISEFSTQPSSQNYSYLDLPNLQNFNNLFGGSND